MRAMILAAGYGTRLWPLTIDRTKPAIPLLGKPLVGYVAEYLAKFGCKEIAVNLHHQPDSVRASLGDGSRFGVELFYVEEPEILGTSGALDNAKEFLEVDTFIVINGKIVTNIDLTDAIRTHKERNALATLVLKRNELREKFSVVHTNKSSDTGEHLVTGFGSAPNPNDTNTEVPLMFTGIQILDPRIFSYIPRGVFSHSTTDVYPIAISKGERIVAHVAEGDWYELSTIPRYLDISLAMLRKEGHDVDIGINSKISTGADVTDTVLWENVLIEPGARVHRAIIGDGVCIRSGETIENAAVVRAELVEGAEPPAKALKGEVRGENFVVSLVE
jgi:NDP-sugar pyrophosphorylase family protein